MGQGTHFFLCLLVDQRYQAIQMRQLLQQCRLAQVSLLDQLNLGVLADRADHLVLEDRQVLWRLVLQLDQDHLVFRRLLFLL